MRKLAAFLIAAGLAFGIVAPSLAQAPPAVPALPDTERRTRYTPVASTGPFAVGFAIYGDGTDYANWIEVWLDGVKLTPVTDWTLSLTSGTLSTAARPLTNARVTLTAARTGNLDIVGARRPRRTAQFTEGAAITARSFNQVLSDLTAMERERWDTKLRTLMVPPGETVGPVPSAVDRASKLFGWDPVGNPVATTGSGGQGPGYRAISTSTVAIALGSKSFTTSTDLAYSPGARARTSSAADPTTHFMEGVVTAYSGGTLTILVDRLAGSGSRSDWNINLAGDVATERDRLFADRTYYVRINGSDSNTGLADTAGGAWRNPQKAYNVIVNGLDLNGYNAEVVIDGAHTTGIEGHTLPLGAKYATSVKFRCTTGSSITTTNSHAINMGDDVGGAGWIYVTGCKLSTAGSSGSTLRATNGASQIVFDNIEFLSVIDNHIEGHHSATIKQLGTYTINGGSSTGHHAFCASGSQIVLYTYATNFYNTTIFPNGIFVAAGGNCYVNPAFAGINGTAVGPRGVAVDGGTIITGTGEGGLIGNAASSESNRGHITGPNGGGVQAKQVNATLTGGGGSFTTASATQFVRRMEGSLVYIYGTITITTNGTANALILSLPTVNGVQLTAAAGGQVLVARDGSTGIGLNGLLASTIVTFTKSSDGTYPGADGKTIYYSGTYSTNTQ